MSDSESKPTEPAWLQKLRNAPIVVVLISQFSAVVIFAIGLTAIMELLQHLQPSEAFILAESSAKSNFSDQISRRAWHRLFWADNFVARIRAGATVPDIDDSWKNYVDSDAEWNTNIMIILLSLENYYSRERSDLLESYVQPGFALLDYYLASIRNGPLMKSIWSGTNSNAADPKLILDCADVISQNLKEQL